MRNISQAQKIAAEIVCDKFLQTLKFLVATCKFPVCMVTDSSLSNNSSKECEGIFHVLD